MCVRVTSNITLSNTHTHAHTHTKARTHTLSLSLTHRPTGKIAKKIANIFTQLMWDGVESEQPTP